MKAAFWMTLLLSFVFVEFAFKNKMARDIGSN